LGAGFEAYESLSDDLTNKRTNVEDYAAFLKRAEVTDLVLTDAVLIISDEGELSVGIWVSSDNTEK
jgi:hypothetical protein